MIHQEVDYNSWNPGVQNMDHQKAESISPDAVDSMLAKELNQMTFDEREKIYEELHGVDPIREETEAFLEKLLQQMEHHLEAMNDDLYIQAVHRAPLYIQGRKFRLLFLRAESYNAAKAASRLCLFLRGKMEFFGPESLGRDLYLTDLTPADKVVLKSGILQLLPARDRSGRAVVADFNMDPTFHCDHVDNLVRETE